jgi:Tfp pilus assembly protein PilE
VIGVAAVAVVGVAAVAAVASYKHAYALVRAHEAGWTARLGRRGSIPRRTL